MKPLSRIVPMLLALAGGSAAADGLGLELNRLEALEQGCRLHLVLENSTPQRYAPFQLDLVVFDGDGVVARRLSLDAAPVRAGKTSVYAFDVPDFSCERFGRVLLNDVTACGVDGGEAGDCVGAVAVSSRAGVELIK